jgi:tetratricopeptide (TPR) repeat protein
MTDATTASSAALVAEGNAALFAGDTYTARQRFRQALEIDPQLVPALIGLAGSVRPYREKREHLERALSIDPGNAEARAVLAQVEARIAAGEVLAPGGVQVREPTGLAVEPPPPEPIVAPAGATLHCYIHPDRETGLRCTNCDRPICADCVRPAAVGQLCPECAKARRPVNYQVSAANAAVAGITAFIVTGVATVLGSYLLAIAGFFGFIVAILLGPVAGELLIRLTDRLTHNKRGRAMQLTVGICSSLGAILGILTFAAFSLSLVVFTIAVVATAVTRLR